MIGLGLPWPDVDSQQGQSGIGPEDGHCKAQYRNSREPTTKRVFGSRRYTYAKAAASKTLTDQEG